MVTALKNLDFANISAGLSAIATSARTAGAAIGSPSRAAHRLLLRRSEASFGLTLAPETGLEAAC